MYTSELDYKRAFTQNVWASARTNEVYSRVTQHVWASERTWRFVLARQAGLHPFMLADQCLNVNKSLN